MSAVTKALVSLAQGIKDLAEASDKNFNSVTKTLEDHEKRIKDLEVKKDG